MTHPIPRMIGIDYDFDLYDVCDVFESILLTHRIPRRSGVDHFDLYDVCGVLE